MPAKVKFVSPGQKIAAAAAAAVITGIMAISLPYFIGQKVISVIDGDSFKIANDQTIRLASLDAPETKLCGCKEATAALTKKILGKRVIFRDEKSDHFGRIIALVYLPDGTLVNEYLVKKYQGDQWFCSEKEAIKAGFTKSPNCI